VHGRQKKVGAVPDLKRSYKGSGGNGRDNAKIVKEIRSGERKVEILVEMIDIGSSRLFKKSEKG